MFRLETSPDARRVTLFYAVQKVRYVEFIAPRALREPRQK
jgi:hypothetical protein